MEEAGKKKSKSRFIIYIVIGLLVIGLIALIVYVATKETRADDAGTVETISKRDVETYVSSTGVIDSVELEEVSSSVIGSKITKLYVKQGDHVAPGQVIAQLDTSSLQEQYVELQKSIAQAKADKMKSNQEYDKEKSDAQSERETEISEIRREVEMAQAEASTASAELEKQRNRYNQYLADPNHSEWDEEALNLEASIDDLERNAMLGWYKANAYQSILDSVLESGDSGSGFDEIRSKINEITDSSIASMEEAAREIQKSIGEGTVRTTVGGVITSLPVKVGDTYVGGPICTVEGVNSYMIYASVKEDYVADVLPGMKVKIQTSATGNEELNGVVTYVAPRANQTSSAQSSSVMAGMSTIGGSIGVAATYQVKIALNEQNPRLRLGMNANLKIITAESDNTLSVPTTALHDDDGEKYVEIVTNMDEIENNETTPYKKEKVKVKVGLVGAEYAEIHGTGISEGEYVYIPEATDAALEELMKLIDSASASK